MRLIVSACGSLVSPAALVEGTWASSTHRTHPVARLTSLPDSCASAALLIVHRAAAVAVLRCDGLDAV